MSFIEVQNLSKQYRLAEGNVNAISSVNLKIEEGEFVSIMGPSGSGKSTFLTTLGGLTKPTGGSVVVDEIKIFELDSQGLARYRLEYLGFIFQNFQLLNYLSVIENVMLPLAVSNNSKSEKFEICMNIMKQVGLENKKNRLIGELSGGEQQRVAIARALVNDPLILLADEPTGNLDSYNSNVIMEIFSELNADGKTIVLVTHDSEVAEYSSRRIKFLDGMVN